MPNLTYGMCLDCRDRSGKSESLQDLGAWGPDRGGWAPRAAVEREANGVSLAEVARLEAILEEKAKKWLVSHAVLSEHSMPAGAIKATLIVPAIAQFEQFGRQLRRMLGCLLCGYPLELLPTVTRDMHLV